MKRLVGIRRKKVFFKGGGSSGIWPCNGNYSVQQKQIQDGADKSIIDLNQISIEAQALSNTPTYDYQKSEALKARVRDQIVTLQNLLAIDAGVPKDPCDYFTVTDRSNYVAQLNQTIANLQALLNFRQPTAIQVLQDEVDRQLELIRLTGRAMTNPVDPAQPEFIWPKTSWQYRLWSEGYTVYEISWAEQDVVKEDLHGKSNGDDRYFSLLVEDKLQQAILHNEIVAPEKQETMNETGTAQISVGAKNSDGTVPYANTANCVVNTDPPLPTSNSNVTNQSPASQLPMTNTAVTAGATHIDNLGVQYDPPDYVQPYRTFDSDSGRNIVPPGIIPNNTIIFDNKGNVVGRKNAVNVPMTPVPKPVAFQKPKTVPYLVIPRICRPRLVQTPGLPLVPTGMVKPPKNWNSNATVNNLPIDPPNRVSTVVVSTLPPNGFHYEYVSDGNYKIVKNTGPTASLSPAEQMPDVDPQPGYIWSYENGTWTQIPAQVTASQNPADTPSVGLFLSFNDPNATPPNNNWYWDGANWNRRYVNIDDPNKWDDNWEGFMLANEASPAEIDTVRRVLAASKADSNGHLAVTAADIWTQIRQRSGVKAMPMSNPANLTDPFKTIRGINRPTAISTIGVDRAHILARRQEQRARARIFR